MLKFWRKVFQRVTAIFIYITLGTTDTQARTSISAMKNFT